MSDRLLSRDASTHPLDPLPLDPSSVVDGSPVATLAELADLGTVSVGVWALTAGTVTDVEVDEVFVVLQGSGSVSFDDGSRIDLQPGAVVHLHAGDRTTWTIRQTVRKVYVALPA